MGNAHPAGSVDRATSRVKALGAFGLAETLISVILVGGLMVAALNTAGASLTTRRNMSDHGVGQLLAQDLMAEIVQQAYQEPTDTPAFGIEGLELATARGAYDDIDDYKGWTASPPQNQDGTAIIGMTGWRRAVEVDWVMTNNINGVSPTETNAKRIRVNVSHHGVPITSLTGVRTNSAATTDPPQTTAVDPTPLPAPIQVL